MDVLFNNPQGVRRAVAAVLGLPLSQVKMGPHQTREGGIAIGSSTTLALGGGVG